MSADPFDPKARARAAEARRAAIEAGAHYRRDWLDSNRWAELAKNHGLQRVFIHAFLDGRDTPPASANLYVAQLQRNLADIGCGEIATMIGRYYAMDRDKRWERTKRAYDLLVHSTGERWLDPLKALQHSYEQGVTDEFVEPACEAADFIV